MSKISDSALKQLFTEARTFNDWQAKEVSDETLREIYDLLKWGPTSANLSPARIVFIRSKVEKEKLLAGVYPLNTKKVLEAPVTVIIAFDEKFYDKVEKLFPLPSGPAMRDYFIASKEFADATAFRNGSLQGAYFIMAARALGLDCGPMSGFDNQKVDETFFAGTNFKSNFICNLGYGEKSTLFPRLPRLDFEEACKIL